jgi:hypothetical protein
MNAMTQPDLPWRFSHFKAFGRSGAHGYHARTTDTKPNQAMQIGSMVHGIWSGLGKFVAYPGPVRRGKEYEKFVADNPDATIMLQSDFDNARRMADAINRNADAVTFLTGTKEQTLFFDWNGLDCRATPDVRGDDFLTELKTTGDASERYWAWHFRRMSYHVQMWMQGIGCASHGYGIKRFMTVAIEQKPPFVVQVYEYTERSLDEGNRLLMLWAEKAKNCTASNSYGGYSQTILPLDIPEDDAVDLDFTGVDDEESETKNVTMAG